MSATVWAPSELVGSVWIKTKGKHVGDTYQIVRVSNRGVTAKRLPAKYHQRHTGNSFAPRMQISFDELAGLYEPEEDRFRLTKGRLEEVKIYVEGKTMLVDHVEKEVIGGTGNLGRGVFQKNDSIITEEVRECISTYHKGNRITPISKFSPSKKRGATGELRNACDDCNQKREEYETLRRARMRLDPDHKNGKVVVAKANPPVQIAEVTHAEASESTHTPTVKAVVETKRVSGSFYDWEVTLIATVTRIVHAESYLDAAAQVDNEGEIVKIERVK